MKKPCLIKLASVSVSHSKERLQTHSTAHIARTASNRHAAGGLKRQALGTIISHADGRGLERRQAETLRDCDGSTGENSAPASSTH